MPITESRGNRSGMATEVHHVSGGTTTDNYVIVSTGDGKAAWELDVEAIGEIRLPFFVLATPVAIT